MSVLVLASLFLAQTPVATAPAAPEAPAAASNKKICKVDTLDTGSRVKKRICRTQVEWENRAEGKNANDVKNIGGR